MAKAQGTVLKYYHNTGSYASPSYTSMEGEISCDIDFSTTEHETTNKSSGAFYEYLIGIRSGTVNCSVKYDEAGTAAPKIISDWLANTLTKVEIKTLDTYKYYGDGYVTNVTVGASVDGVVEMTFTFKFTGTITQAAA